MQTKSSVIPRDHNRDDLQLLSVPEFARRAAISIRGLYGFMQQGKLKFVKLGDRRLIPISELRRVIERGL